MRLRRIADGVCARIDHELQQHAAIEARTADQEVVGRPFATLRGIGRSGIVTQTFDDERTPSA